MTAANITTRLIKGKTTDWINTSFPSKIIRLLKQMFKLEAQGNMFVVLHAIRKSAIIRNKTVALCAKIKCKEYRYFTSQAKKASLKVICFYQVNKGQPCYEKWAFMIWSQNARSLWLMIKRGTRTHLSPHLVFQIRMILFDLLYSFVNRYYGGTVVCAV